MGLRTLFHSLSRLSLSFLWDRNSSDHHNSFSPLYYSCSIKSAYKYFCQVYKYICTSNNDPKNTASGDDLAPIEFFMGKIRKANDTFIDEVVNPGESTSQAVMKIFHGTTDHPALISPPWFCNI